MFDRIIEELSWSAPQLKKKDILNGIIIRLLRKKWFSFDWKRKLMLSMQIIKKNLIKKKRSAFK
jgi:hypothetical protein